MSVSLIYFFVCVALLLFFVVLFKIEETRESRLMFGGVRQILDKVVSKVHYWITHVSIHFGTGAVRIVIHFLIHRSLSLALGFLQKLEFYIDRLQKRNRAVAKIVRTEQTKTHLDLIAEHKASNGLTDAKKQQLKDRAIEGG